MKTAVHKLALRTWLALAMLGIVGSVVLSLLPPLFRHSAGSQPPLTIYLVAGLVGLVVTAAALALAGKFEPSLKRRLLWLAFVYNAFIVAVKLVLAPFGLYELNQTSAFTATPFDPNASIYYVIAAVVIFFLYAGVWAAIYHVHKRRATTKLAAASKTPPASPKPRRRWHVIVPLAVVVAIVLYLSGALWLLAIGFGGLNYLTLVASSAMALPIAILLLAAVALASGAFHEAEETAVNVNDAAVLASLFWLGLGLIVLYHIMWLVFMVSLVSTWPFNTYTPK